MTPDPIARFKRWFAEAGRARVPLPESMALATADARGRPAVRFVLLKQGDADGFVFFTNAGSRKGRELHDAPHAALAFYWDEIGKQVRIEGRIETLPAAAADAYWATRPRASQLAAVASRQSTPVASRSILVARWKALTRRYVRQPVPRPAAWLGFRLVPEAIEFWTRHQDRLHHRELFVRGRRGGWKRRILQP
jgi:pyridoxamine 5'-phosphate oxidase